MGGGVVVVEGGRQGGRVLQMKNEAHFWTHSISEGHCNNCCDARFIKCLISQYRHVSHF